MKIQIESDLNPENCEIKGFEWIGDFIYDVSAPDRVDKEVGDFVKQGCKIGQSATIGGRMYTLVCMLRT